MIEEKRMIKKIGLSLVLLSALVGAVEPIEVSDIEGTYSNRSVNDAQKGIKQSINLGFANTTGNSDTLNINGKYSLSSVVDGLNNKPLKLIFDTTLFVTKNNNTTDNEEYTANLDLEQYITDSWLVYASIDWFRNKFTNYDNKFSIGGGIGNKLFSYSNNSLKLKIGFASNREDFTNAQANTEFSSLNEYIEYDNKISDTSLLYIKVGAMQRMDDFSNDYEVLGLIGLKVKVADNLNLSIEEEIRYDNLPPVGFKQTDTKSIVRLGYDF